MQRKQVMALIVMVVLALGVLFGYDALSDDVIADAQSYEVTAEGYAGPVSLMVHINDDEIVDIEVLEQNETEELGDVAIEGMIAKILEEQSTDVDVESGATESSNAVLAGVNEALAEAGLGSGDTYVGVSEGYGGDVEVEVTLDGNTIVAVNVLEENETENLGDDAIDAMIDKIIEAQSTDVDVETGATVSSNALVDAVSNALEEAGITLGEAGGDSEDSEEAAADYDAEGILAIAPGYGGDVVLDVIMDGDEIVEIHVLEENETADLGDDAIAAMIDKIIEAQSTDVDVESGATVSSEAVIEAVAEATGQEVAESEAPEDPAAAYDLESYEPEGIMVSGKGFQDRYDIYLDVLFDGNEIVEIRVIEHNETKGFGDGALRVVPERIINQQSTEVDIQTGATWTSETAMELVEQACEEAGVVLEEQEADEDAAPADDGGGGG